jgi:hypothetical protein
VNHAFLTGDIADASAFDIWYYGEIAEDMLTRADCNFEIFGVAEMAVGIEKCMSDECSPHYGGNAGGKIERS